MNVYAVENILTFNMADFERYVSIAASPVFARLNLGPAALAPSNRDFPIDRHCHEPIGSQVLDR